MVISSRTRVTAAAGCLAVALAAAMGVAAPSTPSAIAATIPDQPNIVMVFVDDQSKGMMDALPTVQSQIAAKGTTYSNAVVPTSLCCPSRTSLLTGLYSNQSGVFGNNPKMLGGYDVFKANGNEYRTLPVKMEQSDYVTGMFGKVMNGFDPQTGDARMPGWDRAILSSNIGSHYDYSVSSDAFPGELGMDPGALQQVERVSEYSTTFFGERVTEFIEEVPADKPLFALFTPMAPHSPYQFEDKYANAGLSATAFFNDPTLNEKKVKDKPHYVASRKRWSDQKVLEGAQSWVSQSKMLRSIDDQVAEIIATLRREDRLDNTILIYSSDNGYHFGQHRLSRKNTPYRSATDVDLIVRGPNIARGAIDNRLVTANIDVSATILRAAGLPNSTSGIPLGDPLTRAGIPMMASREKNKVSERKAYCGFRTSNSVFIRYATGEEEFYRLGKDPYMLKNVRWKKKLKHKVRVITKQSRRVCTTVSADFGKSFDKPKGGLAKNKKQAKERKKAAAGKKKGKKAKKK